MKEIVDRLQENRQIQLAKSILESSGYRVTKKSKRLKESSEGEEFHELFKEQSYPISDLLDMFGGKEEFVDERGGTEELDVPCEMLGGNYSNVYMLCEEDEGAREVFETWDDIKREDLKTVREHNFYSTLVSTSAGNYVFQNMYGMITIFKKL